MHRISLIPALTDASSKRMDELSAEIRRECWMPVPGMDLVVPATVSQLWIPRRQSRRNGPLRVPCESWRIDRDSATDLGLGCRPKIMLWSKQSICEPNAMTKPGPKGEIMKVLLVNGSPHKHGCTDRALAEVGAALSAEGVDVEVFWTGSKPVPGCMACGVCKELGRCVMDDVVNEFQIKAREADGFVFGGPVHYAHAASSLLGFMDRLFYSNSRAESNALAFKPAAAVTSARRGGTTASLDDITKFFGISQMPIVTSRYWNMVHGNSAEEVEQDNEGLWTMRQLGRNMAWMLKSLDAAKTAGILLPQQESGEQTNFVR